MKKTIVTLVLSLAFPLIVSGQQSATRQLTLEVLPSTTPLRITTTSPLPTAQFGLPYSVTVLAEGGQPPYSWSVSGGVLPAGITLDAVTGTIIGTPTELGLFSFEVTVVDSSIPPPTGFEGLIIRQGDLGIVGTGFGFLSFNKGRLGIAASDQTFASNQYSEGTVSANKPDNAHFGLFVRRNLSNGQRYNCVWGLPTTTTPTGFFILKLDGLAGAPVLAIMEATRTPIGGDVLRIEANGSIIRCLFNGEEILITSDSVLTNGELGMVMTGATQAEFPVPISALPFPVFESWSGGNL